MFCVPAGFGRIAVCKTTCHLCVILSIYLLFSLYVKTVKSLWVWSLCLAFLGFNNPHICFHFKSIDQFWGKLNTLVHCTNDNHTFNHVYWSPSHTYLTTSKPKMMKGRRYTSFSPGVKVWRVSSFCVDACRLQLFTQATEEGFWETSLFFCPHHSALMQGKRRKSLLSRRNELINKGCCLVA